MSPARMRREVVLPGRATKGSQSWEYEATWKLGGQVVRVRIKRDAYAFQSDLHVDVWDPRGRAWNPLLSRPIAGYRVQNVNA